MYDRELMSILADTLDTYRKPISEKWIELVKKNIAHNDKTVVKFSIIAVNKLMNSFIKYIASESKGFKFNKDEFSSMAYAIAYKDISYKHFMMAMNYFEESYTSVLASKIPYDDLVKYLLLVNTTYNNVVSYISEEYFNIKDSTVIAPVRLAELRDDITGNHMERTREYVSLLAKKLGYDEEYIRNIERASLLHDIGKVGIKDSILLKPGKLTQDEFEEIKQHTVIGARTIYEIIKSTNNSKDYMMMAINISLHHHEKYDGSGYPYNLKKDQIPLEARMFALADAYDAIVSKRPYKEPLPHHEAVRRILSDSGKHFDPVVVNAFLKIENSFNKINVTHKQDIKAVM